jgi:hypothetical protein
VSRVKKKDKPTETAFMKEHLPRVPDFVKSNLPTLKFDPNFTLGPPVHSVAKQTLLDAYFNGDITRIYSDMLSRPDHYDAEQKEIIEKLWRKEPLGPEVDRQDIDEIVMLFFDRTSQRKKREQLVQEVQQKLDPTDDPTVKRKLEQAEAEKAADTFEGQQPLKAIKII